MTARSEQSEVLELMAQIGRGEITVADAAPRLRGLLVPVVMRESPTGDAMALLAAEQDDSPRPYTAGSWDDVTTAYVAYGWLTDDQYDELDELIADDDIPDARHV